MTTNKPLLSTVREAAHILRIKRSKVYILISTGAVKASKIGADWRIRTDSLEALVGEIPLEVFAGLAKPSKTTIGKNAKHAENSGALN